MCIYCQGGEHELCDSPVNLESVADGLFLFTCCCKGNAGAFVETVGEPRPVGRPQKDGTDMVDVLSTGRHRAEKLLPNIKGTPCHWRGLLYAGGGAVPIVGCLKGTAEARHHGPDKSVLNNSVGVNLHAICTACHNRWHTLNDPLYPTERPDDGVPFVPVGEYSEHDPATVATQQQIINSELWWATPLESRKEYDSVRSS